MKLHKYLIPKSSQFVMAFTMLMFGFFHVGYPQSLVYKKVAQPAVNASDYTHIAVGDIVGPTGTRTQNSMNLSDELTTVLVNKGSHEILDRNVLMQLRQSGAQGTTIIDESIISSIGEQYQSAVLILGRIQSESIYQELKTFPQSIVVNGCHTMYLYESRGDFTVQLRIVEAKTARLIHAEAISVPMAYESERTCQVGGKLDENEIIRKSIASMKDKILNTLFSYEVNETLYFLKPLFANPFKDLGTAVVHYETGNVERGLDVLKNHTTSSATKAKFKHIAYYNYGIGLLADHQYDAALENFIKAYEINPGDVNYKNMVEFTQREMTGATVASTH